MNMWFGLVTICLLVAFFSNSGETQGVSFEWFNGARIINGNATGDHKPYFAQITLAWRYICGGTIISDRAILTAAQCLYSTVLNDYRVFIGSPECEKGNQHQIINSIVHPKYNAYTHINDIGILITMNIINFEINKIEKLPILMKEGALEVDSSVLIMGFGESTESWGHFSTYLTRATLNVKSNMKCLEAFKITITVPVMMTDDQFCTIIGSDKKDACREDRGGPAVYENGLVGIISWGVGCGREGSPMVFTYVPRYRKWINDNIGPTEMDLACAGSSDLTRRHTVIIETEGFGKCACTILSGRSCLTVSTCISIHDDFSNIYTVYHNKKKFKIESFETGHEINPKWTDQNYDMMIIKFAFIAYDEHYGPPTIIANDNIGMNYTNGILIKTLYNEGLAVWNLYYQNEKVFIIDFDLCKLIYGEILPFDLTTNHFCVYNKECDPAETKRHICADLDGSVVFNNLAELIGLIVWQERCHTHKMAIGLYLTKYFDSMNYEAF